MLDRKLKETIKTKIPGISIAIMREGNLELYQKGVIDVSNPQLQQPVTRETVFEAASLSKSVFAYIVLKQIEKGLLSRPGESPESGLDRPLHEICEFGPPHMRHNPNYKRLTARMLLSHQAGLPNEFGSYVGFNLNLMSENDFNHLADNLKNKPCLIRTEDNKYELFECTEDGWKRTKMEENFKIPDEWLDKQTVFVSVNDKIHNILNKDHIPYDNEKYISIAGTQFDYSGEAYRFLNDVIQYVTKNLHELSQEIFISLGMNNSSFIPHPEGGQQRTMRAMGHDSNNKKDEEEHFPHQFPPHPAASLMTTAEDYAKFLHECFHDQFVREHMFEKPIVLTENDKKAMAAGLSTSTLNCLAWGLGFGLQKTQEGTIAFHWGDINTFRSFCAVKLDKNNDVQNERAVVCLTNSANGPFIFQEVAEPIVGDLSPTLTWLKARENLPIELRESKKPIEQPSVVSQSIFPQHQISSVKSDKENVSKIWVHRKKGG